ncbi:Nif11-like leader peptide family natural product precursor [Argonema antarcticum]|uniref:Nif11-like leader peptide family natural product precursor n=1 Tax=Argonema antarcticum TaxID=2942763 RepID=UPI002013154E|nr:Nif11-like leader peptide family natural product precursor [Argonema antarcticum]MCL1471521.1 Nif11-like leader peptide family natural product precursor [Argonema antarcticum A004/B2]
MSENLTQAINAANLSERELRFIKAQQAIDNLRRDIEQNEALKSQLETAQNLEVFFKIAAENGEKFTVSDLQTIVDWSLENTEANSDELDDYELSEDDLDMVAGGATKARAMSINSYWHDKGIIVDGKSFHLTYQSLQMRSQLVTAVQNMEIWEWLGNGKVRVSDSDGIYGSYEISNMSYDGDVNPLEIDKLNTSIYELF